MSANPGARSDVHLDMTPLLLKEKQVRTLLNIGRSTYYQLIETGKLCSVRHGRLVLVPRDAIDEFIDSLPSASKAERDHAS